MRIIAGSLGGRNFNSTHGHRTHPMSDKIRGALFNALGDIHGLSVLDAYAGTGAIAFEAASRGASRVVAIDIDKLAQRAIGESIASLGVEDQVTLVRGAAKSWIRKSHEQFDITVFDPPYDDMQLPVIERLNSITKVGGIAVYSLPPQARLIMPDNFELIQQKDYGDATLSFYRRTS
ncbi:MAG: methyltransferase [Candidatus Saccharibacteria bacterium]|nr:methyltransferase [Candidatus Saccharibacteria bacterium]